MAANTEDHRKGKLAELDVARALIEMGCTVNFLSFMDVGLDLHLQMPTGLKPPSPGESSWMMSGRGAHVQVKSTVGTSLPGISLDTAESWTEGTRTGLPTLLVAVFPERSEMRLYDPLSVASRAALARARQSGDSAEIRLPLNSGHEIDARDLFDEAVLWMENGRFWLNPLIPQPWADNIEDLWAKTLDLAGFLAAVWGNEFVPAGLVLDFEGDGVTCLDLMAHLVETLLDAAGAPEGYLDDPVPAPDPSHGTYPRREYVRMHGYSLVSTTYRDADCVEWSKDLPFLPEVVHSRERDPSAEEMIALCTRYGQCLRHIKFAWQHFEPALLID